MVYAVGGPVHVDVAFLLAKAVKIFGFFNALI